MKADYVEALKQAQHALEGVLQVPEKISMMYILKVVNVVREALANEALDKKAENARELGLDYEPADGMQVSKVWWDGEKLKAKPIPFVEFYKPAQRTWVGLTDEEAFQICVDCGCLSEDWLTLLDAIEAKLRSKNEDRN